jgi:tetratricopeptide (TPR) repeat protein
MSCCSFMALLFLISSSTSLCVQVCVHKAMGNTKKQVDTLNGILRQFPNEAASWQELGDIYLATCDYLAAAHCFEELVLLGATTAAYQIRLGDCYYTIGGFDYSVLARKHYALSLIQQSAKHNLRALYGVIYACQAVAASAAASASGKGADKEKEHELKVNAEMLSWAKEQLAALAAAAGDGPLSVVQAAIC